MSIERRQKREPLRIRAAELVKARISGMTFQQLADAFGYVDRSAAARAYDRAVHNTVWESLDEMRKLESMRLDDLHFLLWPSAMQGDIPAINAILKIMERRAKLWGLDAPTKIMADITQVFSTDEIDGEVARLVAILDKGDGKKPRE